MSLTRVHELDKFLEDSLLNNPPLVVPLGHLLEVNTRLDIFPEPLDQLDVDIRLQEGGTDLLEEGVEDVLIDDCRLAQVVESARDLSAQLCQHHGECEAVRVMVEKKIIYKWNVDYHTLTKYRKKVSL